MLYIIYFIPYLIKRKKWYKSLQPMLKYLESQNERLSGIISEIDNGLYALNREDSSARDTITQMELLRNYNLNIIEFINHIDNKLLLTKKKYPRLKDYIQYQTLLMSSLEKTQSI